IHSMSTYGRRSGWNSEDSILSRFSWLIPFWMTVNNNRRSLLQFVATDLIATASGIEYLSSAASTTRIGSSNGALNIVAPVAVDMELEPTGLQRRECCLRKPNLGFSDIFNPIHH